MMVQDTLSAAIFSLDALTAAMFSLVTVTAAMFCLAVPHISFTNRGSVVRELGCAHVAVADYALVSSALNSCMWVLEMPQEAQHVNPDVKLTQKAAAVRSVLPSRGSKCHTAHTLVLSLACLEKRGRTSLLSSSASHMQCHKLQCCPPCQDGQSILLRSPLKNLGPVWTWSLAVAIG